MSQDGLLIALVMFAISIAWIAFPLLRPDKKVLSPGKLLVKKQHDQLNTRYSQILSAIRDMDEDHLTGKINSEDYERERQIWAQRGVEVLKKIDLLENDNPNLATPVKDDLPDDNTIDDAIESAVSDYLNKTT